MTWRRHTENPVIEPDPRWYATLDGPVVGSQRCRDLTIIPDPEGGWYGFYAARLRVGHELPQLNCVACVRSDDLLHWEHLPPAFSPSKYCTTEVTEVFRLDGQYYLLLLAGHNYGNRGLFSDPYVTTGTIYAVSERPEGPYRELEDNVLLGANTYGPLSARTVLYQGQRYLLYADHERAGARDGGQPILTGTLTTPKQLVTRNDRLVALYSERIEAYVSDELVGAHHPASWRNGPWRPAFPAIRNHWTSLADGVLGEVSAGLDGRLVDATLDDGILEVEITLFQGVAAGLAFRLDTSGFWEGFGATVVLDAERQVIEYQEEAFFDIYRETRKAPVVRGVPMRLRVVLRGEHIEGYLDDVLYLAFPRYRYRRGRFGLFVDRSKALFRDFSVRRLSVDIPWEPR
jgi:hypothetical protein